MKLQDKKTSKATTVQTIELTPELILDPVKSFRYGYRNVIVIKKMTFPNDKILTIFLSVEYEDVLNADSFHKTILYEE